LLEFFDLEFIFMPNDIQSIEDIISDNVAEGSAEEKLIFKEKEMKVKAEEKAAQKMAPGLGVSYINLVGFPIVSETLSLISEEEAGKIAAVCFFYDGRNLRLAALNPQSEEVAKKAQELKNSLHVKVGVYLISRHSLDFALGLYRNIPKIKKIIRGIEITEDDLNMYSDSFSSFKDLQEAINNLRHSGKVSEIVAMIMAAAVKIDSSDIHIEAEESGIKVRFRIDGVLHDAAILDKEIWKNIVSRMKSLTGVKINVTEKPQDGRMAIYLSQGRIDIRASFLPTNYGESVVMRLLKSTLIDISFENLGLNSRAFERLKREVERPNGMIITTGPTGSGKTTTLYAVLKKLNTPETKIITIEDPIEYQIAGINQSQASEKYTFAKGLRSVVRQDPDVIMIGEIRDLETAEIAIQSALTGHLVLSTIHTNDAAGTVPRFLSMGVKPFLLAPALNAMIGQRLVRKICEKCKIEKKLDEPTEKRVVDLLNSLPAEEKNKIDFNNLKFYEGKGCEACQGIGFKGRMGIFEIMDMNTEIEKLILSGSASEYDMRANSVKNGMITMAQDGLLKALAGTTTVEEVFRVAE
jgi:type II secretory ATPase GspE/PulE/Tfp pilus assembly ATPase PilB-like protein